jgi:acetyltransferase-like isoleucine patch superfamily enzyme
MSPFVKDVLSKGGTVGENCTLDIENYEIGFNVNIKDGVSIKCKKLKFGNSVSIESNVNVNVRGFFSLGDRSVVGANCRIQGRHITIGRELWSGINVTIGGGSSLEVHSKLSMGYWCHLGDYAFVNTAREVAIGNEVGMGIRTSIFTHGAYQSVIDGFPVNFGPVTIGDRVWLPNAIVNPGVTIGHDVVVGAGSVVTRDLPSGCLAVGTPATVTKENEYPKHLSDDEIRTRLFDLIRTFSEIMRDEARHISTSQSNYKITIDDAVLTLDPADAHGGRRCILVLPTDTDVEMRDGLTILHPRKKLAAGSADVLSERFRDFLRRYGIRFTVEAQENQYVDWSCL